jgi:SAM-dependent methyltransferase
MVFSLLQAGDAAKKSVPVLTFEEYKEAIEILSSTSKHNELIFETIQSDVLSLLHEKNSFLDIGSGPGILTHRLSQLFDEGVAVEPNPALWSLYQDNNVFLYKGSWENYPNDKQFSFVLCSHMLYHLDRETMKSFIKKALNSTKQGGVCLIALMAPRGQNHELHMQFNENYVNSSQIKEILEELNAGFQVRTATNTFEANSTEQMSLLCRFLILEDCLTKEQREQQNQREFDAKIANFVTHFQNDGKFFLGQEEDYFIIQKFEE